MFRFKYKKPSSGEIRLPSTSYHVNYIKPLLMSVDAVQTSILHFFVREVKFINSFEQIQVPNHVM
jgi:hypothetical protein